MIAQARQPHRKAVLVAAAQYPLDAMPDFEVWSDKASRWAADGAATGAALLAFPEYGALELAAPVAAASSARGGGSPGGGTDLARLLARCADCQGDADAVWRALAARHGVHILAPSGPERRGAHFVNAARLYAPGGGVGVQEKLVMTPFEHDWGIAPGTAQRVFDTSIGRIGIAICYDSEFPLLVRALAEAGADIVLVPSCTEHASGYHRVRTAALARALESQIATVMSPTVGEAAWSPAIDRNFGAAGIFAPPDTALSMTGVLGEGQVNTPGWITAEIDLDALCRLREAGEMRNRRDWARQKGVEPLDGHVDIVRLD